MVAGERQEFLVHPFEQGEISVFKQFIESFIRRLDSYVTKVDEFPTVHCKPGNLVLVGNDGHMIRILSDIKFLEECIKIYEDILIKDSVKDNCAQFGASGIQIRGSVKRG